MNKLTIFFLGIITALTALFLEALLSIFISPSINFVFEDFGFFVGFFVLIEEILKLIIVFRISKISNSLKKAVLNSILVGLGFGITEITLYNFNKSALGIPINYFNLLLIHLLTFTILSYFTYHEKSKFKITLFLIISFCFHLFYNLAVFFAFKPIILTIISFVLFTVLFLKVFLPIKDL